MEKLLEEFNMLKRYNGDESETRAICTMLANREGIDVELFINYVYIHRYESDDLL